jgi:hypothetical protein
MTQPDRRSGEDRTVVPLARVRRRLVGLLRSLMRGLAGLAALGCAVAGVWLLFGLGWALLAAVPFLLLLDARVA